MIKSDRCMSDNKCSAECRLHWILNFKILQESGCVAAQFSDNTVDDDDDENCHVWGTWCENSIHLQGGCNLLRLLWEFMSDYTMFLRGGDQ